MSDIVVTVSKTFTHPTAPGKRGLAAWIAEGDPAGEPWSGTEWAFIRGGGAAAVTIPERIRGFRGWRYRWWQRNEETPFPDWMIT